MDTLLAFLSLIFLLAFIVGLIKPSLVKMHDRKRNLIYLGAFFLTSIVGSTLYPTEKKETITKKAVAEQESKKTDFKYADLKLGEFRNKEEHKRHEIVDNFNKSKGVAAASSDGMYACMSEFSNTKSKDLAIPEVLGWCFDVYQRAPEDLNKKVNFDTFQKNFSGWDGSYRPLEQLIKESMNDDSSYDHVSTRYTLVMSDDPHAVIKTIFRGKNAFGGIIKDSVTARINIQTGEVEEILQR